MPIKGRRRALDVAQFGKGAKVHSVQFMELPERTLNLKALKGYQSILYNK